jgi:hypothetical protein
VTDQPANETEASEQEWERPILFPLDLVEITQNDGGSNFDGSTSS